MSDEYVEQREGGFWLTGSRVSFDSIVYAFLAGQTAESIAQSLPSLSLRQVYGAITFYLANREQVDVYLAKSRKDFESVRRASREADPTFYQKLADARRHQQTAQP
jgi:uncharacterized protein (DUF433 family)